MTDELRLEPRYAASIDRAGHAVAAGGLALGTVATLFVIAGGVREPGAIVAAWLIGSVFGCIAVVAVGAPVWLSLHLLGRRGPRAAALAAFLATFALLTMAQLWNGEGGALRWASAFATAALFALGAAGVALLMWRIAYRRVG